MEQELPDKETDGVSDREDGEGPLLEIKNLKTHFHTDEGTVRAVDGISYELERGESLGIVGESGSGKSVSQISILQLIPTPPGEIVDGEILFKGEDLLGKNLKEIRKIRGNQISMIWQDPMTSLNPFLRISTQLTEVLDVHRDISEEKARAAAIEMLEKVGIPGAAERVDNYPHEFSGGMRQRVMIAMALLCEPELLIADEPTTALDVTIQAQILDLIKDLKTDLNTSVIVITHDLGVVAGMADRILVMYGGRAMEEADARDLFRRPAHPYTVGMLKSVPRIDRGKEEKLIPIEGNPPDASKEIPGCPFAERCNWAVDKCEEEFPEPVEVEERRRSYCWRAKEVYDAKIGSRASSDRLEKVEDHIAAGHTVDDDFLAELNKGRDGTTADT